MLNKGRYADDVYVVMSKVILFCSPRWAATRCPRTCGPRRPPR